jgi:thioesterase domain-containing protein
MTDAAASTLSPAVLDGACKLLEQGIGFVKNTGLVVETLDRGHVRCRMPFTGNGNHIGTMYAGALFTLAEIPGGALFLTSFDTRRCFPVVKALNLRFLKPAKSDVWVTARLDEADIQRLAAECADTGKAEFTLNLQLTDGGGQVVASSEGIYQLRRL